MVTSTIKIIKKKRSQSVLSKQSLIGIQQSLWSIPEAAERQVESFLSSVYILEEDG